MKHVRRSGWWLVALLLASGCVTPVATKEASRAHGQNLADLKSAVESYKATLADYFKQLEAQQREAYIAYMVGWEIDHLAKDQFESLPYAKDWSLQFAVRRKQAQTPSDATVKQTQADSISHDFITLGEAIFSTYTDAGRNFDLQLLRTEQMKEKTAALDKKRAELKERQAELEKLRSIPEPVSEKDKSAITEKENGIKQLAESIKELSEGVQAASQSIELLSKNNGKDEESRLALNQIFGVAENLRGTAKTLDGKLNHLIAQIEVMQRFHGVIDTYLSIDATIDGKALAEAAASGAATDLSKFPELKKMLDGFPEVKQILDGQGKK